MGMRAFTVLLFLAAVLLLDVARATEEETDKDLKADEQRFGGYGYGRRPYGGYGGYGGYGYRGYGDYGYPRYGGYGGYGGYGRRPGAFLAGLVVGSALRG